MKKMLSIGEVSLMETNKNDLNHINLSNKLIQHLSKSSFDFKSGVIKITTILYKTNNEVIDTVSYPFFIKYYILFIYY
jgi:hypothetical protein